MTFSTTALAEWMTKLGIAGLAGMARLGRGAAPEGAILALEQVLALDPRRRVCLIRCGEQRLLVLTGGAQDVLLGWLPSLGSQPAPTAGAP